MDKSDYYPIVVIPGVPCTDGISFNYPNEQLIVSGDTKIIWDVLSLCNGFNSVDNILKKIKAEDKRYAEDITLDFVDLSIIVDSRHVYSHFHRLTCNPPVYSSSLSFREIRVQAEKRDKAISSNSNQLPDSSNLSKLILERTSCRSFDTSYTIPLELMNEILLVAYSLRDHAVPSAGGLYPLDIKVVFTNQQNGSSFGIYEVSNSHGLAPTGKNVFRETMEYIFDSDGLLFCAAAIIVISADLQAHGLKYSNRGYRYTLLEAGHVAQNIHLAAVEANLTTLEYGGFNDQALKSGIGLAPNLEPIITVAIGKQADYANINYYQQLEDLTNSYVGRKKPITRVFMTSLGQNEHNECFVSSLAHFKPARFQNAKKSYRDRYSSGTARSNNLAMIKAIAEGYERYCSGVLNYDVIKKARQLDNDWVDPREYTPYSNAQVKRFTHLMNFSENENIHWIKGVNLQTDEHVYVPVELVFYPISSEKLGRKLVYEANSSGVAAHTEYEKAMLGALLELIERDAIMHSWLTRTAPCNIKHESLPGFLWSRCQYWESVERDVYILDHSHDGINIANVCITSMVNYPAFVNGSAASIDSMESAINKAFQEAELGLIMELHSKSRHSHIKAEEVFSPSDHAKYYYSHHNLAKLLWLFEGPNVELTSRQTNFVELVGKYSPIMVDLTLEDPLLKVVRVLSSKLIPINFGFKNEHYTHRSLSQKVHYESLTYPHYFA